MICLRRIAAIISIAIAALHGVTQPAADTDEVQGKQWWAHVQYLASNAMQGRQTGSTEYLNAAAYVVEKFRSYGLQPAGVNGTWYQPVHFDVQHVFADQSSMSLVADGKTTPLALGNDAILGTRMAQPKTVDAPLVFIGYGLHLPEVKYDDFDSVEVPRASLKGKIVVYINVDRPICLVR